MATVALTQARRLEIRTAQVRSILEVVLLEGPVDQNDLLRVIKDRGIVVSTADLVTIRNALVADATIVIT